MSDEASSKFSPNERGGWILEKVRVGRRVLFARCWLARLGHGDTPRGSVGAMAPSALGRSAAGHRLSYSAAWPLAGHEEGAGGDGAGAADAATPALALSTDFSLLPEIRKIYRYELSARERIQLQLRRWRRHPIFGIVENKLLCGSMLASLGPPE